MRYVVGFVVVLALPLTVSAQPGEDDPVTGEPAPSADPVPEVPSLQLKLDEAGVGVVPPPSRTPGFTLEELEENELRVKRARTGFVASSVALALGLVLGIAGLAGASGGELIGGEGDYPGWADPVAIVGASVAGAGFVGMITAGGMMAHRRRALKKLDPDKGRWWQRR